jgi:hypothetical protein
MQTFTLSSGFTVTTQRVGQNIEFTTRNADGDVISTVPHSYSESVPLLRKLACRAK